MAGELLISPSSLVAPGLTVGTDGALRFDGEVRAPDILLLDPDAQPGSYASLSNEVRLALTDRVRDGGISDRNFKGPGSISAASFGSNLPGGGREVLPASMGGTGLGSDALGASVGAALGASVGAAPGASVPLVGSGGVLAAAAGVAASVSGLSVAREIRLATPDGHHALSNAGGRLVAYHSSAPSVAVAACPYRTGTAPSGETRPAAGAVAFERLSYRRARYTVTAAPGNTAGLSEVLFAEYSADGVDPSPAWRPRGPREAATGLSPLPYGAPPSSRDEGWDGVRAAAVPASGGAAAVEVSDVPGRRHRAVRAVARDGLGVLSEASELVWGTVPPASRALVQPAYAGLTVSCTATAGPGPVAVRHGLLRTVYGTSDVPDFPWLTKANADGSPETAWALWESLSNSTTALEAAAPAFHVPAGAAESNMEFASDRHLAYDAATASWRDRPNSYSASYMPFVLLADARSNMSLRMFDAPAFVTITNPSADVQFVSVSSNAATFRYSLADVLSEVRASVFPLTPSLMNSPQAEPAAGDGVPVSVFRNMPKSTSAAGPNEYTLSDLRHTTFHRLVLELEDLQGGSVKNYIDFSTADGADPSLTLTSSAASSDGLTLAWRASDAHDGGISGVVAFSGSTPPVSGPDALRDRLLSAEARYTFPGASAAPTSGSAASENVVLGGATFSNAADAHHLSHYVQLVASDTASVFGMTVAANRPVAVDFGAEVPAVLSAAHSNPASHGVADAPNAVSLGSFEVHADTRGASVYAVALSARAAQILFGGSAGDAPHAASNLWDAVERSPSSRAIYRLDTSGAAPA